MDRNLRYHFQYGVVMYFNGGINDGPRAKDETHDECLLSHSEEIN